MKEDPFSPSLSVRISYSSHSKGFLVFPWFGIFFFSKLFLPYFENFGPMILKENHSKES